ncbi:nucleoid-associated protein [Geomonas sp. Red276]
MIQNFIIHRVIKSVGAGQTTIQTGKQVLEVTHPVEILLTEILKLYNNKSARAYGIFQSDQENYPFSKYVDQYLVDPDEFINFTVNAMQTLQKEIKDSTLATGGYISFIHYQTDDRNYIMVVMLNDKTGTAIDETLHIKETIHLDMSKLHFAARLNVTDWKSGGNRKYLSFIKGRGADGISQYFRKFVGCDEFTDSRKLTEKLIQAVNDFAAHKGLSEEDRENLKKTCFDFCDGRRRKKEPVLLEELANCVWEVVPEEFLAFINSEKYQLSNSFEPHRDTLRRLYRFSGKEKGLTISFDSELLGKRVHYNKKNETLTINGLPKELKQDLDEKYADATAET